MRFIDLFCGIGGFRIAVEEACHVLELQAECVFSSDIDPQAQETYQKNFKEKPRGDIAEIPASTIPHHDLLLAGFPCQAFSICGRMKGFEDARGTLFFHIARILQEHLPASFVLENVKMLQGHNQGQTLAYIIDVLKELGYHVWYKVLNALDFGLPQKRERIFIVGSLFNLDYTFPVGGIKMKPLSEILETQTDAFYNASNAIKNNRQAAFKGGLNTEPSIWHENKSGNISAYPYSCALRSGASYNYLLVNGERRLTEREMLRLQGFPESFNPVGSYTTTRKQAGNSLPVPCAKAVIYSLLQAIRGYQDKAVKSCLINSA